MLATGASRVAAGMYDIHTPARVFQNVEGQAIHGFDAVAYFIDQRPVHGLPAFKTKWNGAVWQFASLANRTAFESNPYAFAPRYGGYCAFGLADQKRLFPSNPNRWSIVSGQLYLNFDEHTRASWVATPGPLVSAGDAAWAALAPTLS